MWKWTIIYLLGKSTACLCWHRVNILRKKNTGLTLIRGSKELNKRTPAMDSSTGDHRADNRYLDCISMLVIHAISMAAMTGCHAALGDPHSCNRHGYALHHSTSKHVLYTCSYRVRPIYLRLLDILGSRTLVWSMVLAEVLTLKWLFGNNEKESQEGLLIAPILAGIYSL